MIFPHQDTYWQAAADFLKKRFGEKARLVAPTEFHEIFPHTFPYDAIRHLDLRQLDAFVIHKGALSEVGLPTCTLLIEEGIPLFGNEVFVVYGLKGRRPFRMPPGDHFAAFHRAVADRKNFDQHPLKQHSEFLSQATVILMTTYNRPGRLAAALESISQLKAPILLVNDGSSPEHHAAYAEVYKKFQVRVIEMPDNRGLPNALNTGLSYWLADPQVEWISYLQDDVEVRLDLLVALARVQDPEKYPLLTGRLNTMQKVYGETEVNGQRVIQQRMSPGLHLHAHRTYWEKMLPVPSPYFQSPKKWPGAPLRGADEDWWISLWSPHSVVKQGKHIAVLPGMVRTLTVLEAESTWGNPGQPEPALSSPVWPVTDFIPAQLAKSPVPVAQPIHLPNPRNFWETLAQRFGQKQEAEIHPHTPAEKAESYHAIDSGSTELEVLNFINALVCLFKPQRVLETGTFLGFGTCAIADGLRSNNQGRLSSIELDPVHLKWAREHMWQFDPKLEQRVDFFNVSSLTFLENYEGLPFDLLFLDSELDIRAQEFSIARKRGLIAVGAVCVIHDTSLNREDMASGDADDFRDRHLFSEPGDAFEVFQFPYSRGFHLLRYLGEKRLN